MITSGHSLDENSVFTDTIYQPKRKVTGDNNLIGEAMAWEVPEPLTTTEFDAGIIVRDQDILFSFDLAEDDGTYGRKIIGRFAWNIIKDTLIDFNINIKKQGKETGRTEGPLVEVIDVENKVFSADTNAFFGDSGSPSYIVSDSDPTEVASLGILNGAINGNTAYTAVEEIENRFGVTV